MSGEYRHAAAIGFTIRAERGAGRGGGRGAAAAPHYQIVVNQKHNTLTIPMETEPSHVTRSQ